MKIIHTDRDDSPAVELSAEEFLKKNAEINAAKSAKDVVLDLGTGEKVQKEKPAETKSNSKAWLWVIILIVLIIIAAIAYNYVQKRNEQTNG